MVNYKHIVWDWNGTLLDDTWLCLDIMNKQRVRIGKLPLTLLEYRRTFDFPVKNFYEQIGFDFAQESYESVAQNFITEYTKRRFECDLHFGVAALLAKYRDYGFSQSILSAYAQDVLKEMTNHFGIDQFFSHIVGLDNHYASGKLEEGKQLMQQLDIPANQIVLIGDTTHDHEVAQSLGIDCLLVSQGHQDPSKLQKREVPVVPTLSETMLYTFDR